jgi:hypothetical protein
MAMRVLAAFLLGLTAVGAGQAAEVAPGVAVDERGAVFLMSPARRVEAREIATGALRWTTADAVRPLFAARGRVLAQADAPEGRLDLVLLDALSGRRVAAQSLPLPEGVAAPIDEVLGTRFDLRVEASGPQARLEWAFERRPVRGALLVEGGEDAVTRARGAVVVDLAAARFAAEAARPLVEGPPPLPPALAAEADAGRFRQRPLRVGGRFVTIEEAGGALVLKRWTEGGAALPDTPIPPGVVLQMGSADGRHLLVSALVPGAPAERAYAWTVLGLDSGAAVAALAASTAAAPFVVAGGRVLIVQPPMGHRDGAAWRQHPRRVEAFDAPTGARVWMQAVRDTAYDGPFPP